MLLVLKILCDFILLLVLTIPIETRRRLVEGLNIHGFPCMHSLLIEIDIIEARKVLSGPDGST